MSFIILQILPKEIITFRSIALLGASNHLRNNIPHKISTDNWKTLFKNEVHVIAEDESNKVF